MDEQEENKLEENIKRHVSVLFEDMKSQFMAFGEGQQVLSDKVDGMNDRLIRVEGRLDGVEDKLVAVENRLTGVEDKIVAVENRLTGVEDKIVAVENRLDGVESELKIMNKKFDGKAEKMAVDDHEKRLLKLEKSSLATG